MIQQYSRLRVADNTGARTIQCIRVIGRSQKTTAGVGAGEPVVAEEEATSEAIHMAAHPGRERAAEEAEEAAEDQG